jgi:hypothetical protein
MSPNRVVRPSSAKVVPMTTSEANVSDLLLRYGFGSTPFIGTENATYERRLVFDTATGLSVSPLAVRGGRREAVDANLHHLGT